MTPRGGAGHADVMLATLVGYASLVAAGYDLAPAAFQQNLEHLLDLAVPQGQTK